MSPTISAAQRDALYDQILDRLSGIGDIEIAIEAENYRTAERLGREYSDYLRLLLDDLGIGDGGDGEVELTTPSPVLRRILPRLQTLAEQHIAGLAREQAQARELECRNRLVAETCERLLAELDAGAAPA